MRYLTPHSKWSIHSEYQDNLFMLSLSPRRPGDLDEPGGRRRRSASRTTSGSRRYNRNGVVVARAVVSHRMPAGTVFMYHAKDRTVDVPRTETSGLRGGIHNSLTRLMIKPTHLVGGYAQLSLRLQLPRAHRQPARRGHRDPPPRPGGGVLNAGHGPDGHGDEPRQVHRVPHLLGHLQAGVDQPRRRRVRVVQQRRDPPRPGLSAHLPGPGALAGRLGAQPRGRLQLRVGRRGSPG